MGRWLHVEDKRQFITFSVICMNLMNWFLLNVFASSTKRYWCFNRFYLNSYIWAVSIDKFVCSISKVHRRVILYGSCLSQCIVDNLPSSSHNVVIISLIAFIWLSKLIMRKITKPVAFHPLK